MAVSGVIKGICFSENFYIFFLFSSLLSRPPLSIYFFFIIFLFSILFIFLWIAERLCDHAR